MNHDATKPTPAEMTRRQALGAMGTVAIGSVAATHLVKMTVGEGGILSAQALPLSAVAGIDRVVMLKGKTYLNGWTGYGAPPRRGRGQGRGAAATPPPDNPGPAPTTRWTKLSGPGTVTFAIRRRR